ncbi:MAG: hypothetical protein LAO77_19475 [Acidobacteriia bacterium]|nr:hypothetical protein [Terriglobia bacterium]
MTAVVAGVIYTLSPLTVWCLLALAVLARWAARDIAGRERRWLLAVFGAALGLRLLAIGLLPFLVDPWREPYTSYFGDGVYAIQRSVWIRNIALGIPVGSRDFIEAFEPQFGWSGYNYVLAFLHMVCGRSPYGVACFSTVLFLAAALILHRCCRRAFGPLAAFAGLAIVLFMPSLFAWSVAPLKEGLQFLLLATIVAALAALAPRRWMTNAGAALAVLAALIASGTLRSGGTAIALTGIGAATVLWLSARRTATLAAVIVGLALAIPLAASSRRVDAAVAVTIRDAAIRHLGHARSPGAFYRLLDDKLYAGATTDPEVGPPFDLDFGAELRFLIRAVQMFFAQPLPWAPESFKWLALLPQQVLWYLTLPLALVGVIRGFWREPRLTSLLAGMIVAGIVVVAPNSGNVGTLIRHRDMIVPFVLALAGFGAVTLAARVVTPLAAVRTEKVVGSWH